MSDAPAGYFDEHAPLPPPRPASLSLPMSADAATLMRLEGELLLPHAQVRCSDCVHLVIGQFRRAYCPIDEVRVAQPDRERNCTRVVLRDRGAFGLE